MPGDFNRYKINQQVQSCLVRHAADLSKLTFSYTGKTLYLAGGLYKEPKDDFHMEEIKIILEELGRLEHVSFIQTDIDNWTISRESGTWDIRLKDLKKDHR